MLLLTSEDPEREIESLDNRLANEEIYLKLAENLESFLARLRDTSASTGTSAII